MMVKAQDSRGVGGFAGIVLRAWKNRAGIMSRSDRSMRVVESLSLGGRKQIHLVTCGDQQFLVGTGADSVQCIVPTAANTRLSAEEA